MSSFDTKYFRILENFNFNNINKENFPTLIEAGIYDEFDLSPCYKRVPKESYETEYFGIELFDENSFSEFSLYNDKEYHLKKEVFSEMIYVKDWMLNSFYDSDIELRTNEIELLVAQELILENKIKVIEDNYKKYFSQIANKKFYLLYKNNSKTWGYDTWEEYVYHEYFDCKNEDFIANFLKGDDKFLPTELNKLWNSYFIFSGVSDYCEEKKNELLNIKPSTMSDKNKEEKRYLSFRLAFFEELMKINNWDDMSASLKGKILTHILGDYHTNIRDYYLELVRENSIKFKDAGAWANDRVEAGELLKKLIKKKNPD